MRWTIAIICGFLIWALVATIDYLLFPYTTSVENALDALLVIALVMATVACTVRYFKMTESDFLVEGAGIGALWFVIAVALGFITTVAFPGYNPRIGTVTDLPSFMLDIGIFFLLVPCITIAFGYILEKKMLTK